MVSNRVIFVSLIAGTALVAATRQANADCKGVTLTFVNNSSNPRGMLEILKGDYKHGGKHTAKNESSITYPDPKEFVIQSAPFKLAAGKTKSVTIDLPIDCANKIKWVIQTSYGDRTCTGDFKSKSETFAFKNDQGTSIKMSCD